MRKHAGKKYCPDYIKSHLYQKKHKIIFIREEGKSTKGTRKPNNW